ncbi:MAG TPA: hypothetical protein DCE41_19920, partial [Cytophagales bacterium]|nr:hypothetical protein [Cytophagales bacterium]
MNSQRIAKTSFARLALTWVFFLALILHLPGFAQSTVSGTVSLADSAVPAGISVYFNATSPSAASDTAVTDSAGFYSISLQNGQYEILFEKDGYLSETVEVLLLSQNTTIDSTTLQVKTVELISGTIPSGTWTADKEYLINGDAELSFGDTLVVEPGTQITLASAVDWNVFGMIYLQGTEEEYIQIDIASTGFAGQITFAYTSTIDPADVVYTHFTGIGESHVFINQDPVDFRNCIFDKIELIYEFGNQIEETESIVEITSNQFINSRMNLGTGDKDEEIKYTIDGNTFFHDGSQSNSFTAISTLRLDTLIVSGNTIQGYNLAIYSNNVETLEINKNQFIKNQEGMHLDFGDFFTPEASIIQNTFYQNTAGIHLNAVNADVNSNLFLENNYDLKINTYGTITVNYNLFEDTTQIFLEENEFSIPPSLSNTGLILTTQNGWPADIYFNS